MPKLPVITPRRLIAALLRSGFVIDRRKGSHAMLRHSDGRMAVIPCHAKDIPTGTLRGILNDIGMTAEQLSALL